MDPIPRGRGRRAVTKPINVKISSTIKRKRSSADEGKPISPVALTREKIASQWVTHKQCAYIGDDYFSIKFNSGINLSAFTPILTQDSVLDDGIYTWVILSLNNEPPKMYLKKTLTSYEFGTKHQEILYSISCANDICNNYNLYYAGELLKDGNNIYFNLESGTYMKEKLNPKKKTLGTIKASIINAKDMINERINKTGGLTIEEVDKSFITHEGIPLTPNDLKIYSDLGAKIYKFNNAENCAAFNTRGNTLSLQELGGSIVNISSPKTGGIRSKRKTKRKLKRTKKIRLKGGKYKKVWCSQSIVNLPRMECVKKNCTGTKKYKDNVKKLAKLNKQYYTMVSNKCNIKITPGKYGELDPETDEQWDCLRSQRKTKLFKTLLKLEDETSLQKCEKKHCGELNYMDDCIDLGEEECRKKYKDIIEKQKQKILPLKKCL